MERHRHNTNLMEEMLHDKAEWRKMGIK